MSAGLRTRVRTWSNVLLLVRLWCAVQMTVRFGMSVHRMTTRLETVKVLPVWRQMLNTTPPTEAANVPSALRPRMSVSSPCCQRS